MDRMIAPINVRSISSWYRTRDLSMDVSCNVGLIGIGRPKVISARQHKSKYYFDFYLKWQVFWFPWCSAREDLFIDVSITNVGLILTKVRWFQLFGKGQNSNFLKKKIKFSGFCVLVLVKTFLLMYQLLLQDWYWRSWVIFFLGVRTDRPAWESSYGNMSAHKKFQLESSKSYMDNFHFISRFAKTE